MNNGEIRVRMAPSPTGTLHVGSLRTVLYDYFLAKKDSGKLILRIEDTDQARKIEKGNEIIKETFELYGIEIDEGPGFGGEFGPYIQSERLDIYKKYSEELVEKGHAYHCFCSEARLEEMREQQKNDGKPTVYDRTCRNLSADEVKQRLDNGEPHVVRMKMPTEGETIGVDEVMGKVKFKNELIEDTVIIKSDGFPTYHFAVVVDDHLMGITHVLRGSEWLPSLPKHVVLYEMFGWDLPKFAHIPLILNPDGRGKLSKRKGALASTAYLRKGYMRETIFNYFSLIGWSPRPEDANPEDIYSIDQLIKFFDLSRLQKAGGRYDPKKLDAISGKHIRMLSTSELADRVIEWAEKFVIADWISDSVIELEEWEIELKRKVSELLPKWKADRDYFEHTLGLVHERLKYFSEIPDAMFFMYSDELTWTDEDWNLQHTYAESGKALKELLPQLDEALCCEPSFDHEQWEAIIRGYADGLGWNHGEVFMLVRSATTGKLQSPPLLESFEVIGWEKARSFVEQAIVWLEGRGE